MVSKPNSTSETEWLHGERWRHPWADPPAAPTTNPLGSQTQSPLGALLTKDPTTWTNTDIRYRAPDSTTDQHALFPSV